MLNEIKLFLKKTIIYNIYLQIKYPKYIKHLKQEKLFYKKIVKKNSLAFDVGANVGNKTALFLSLGLNVISIEPDEKNYRLLQKRFKNKNAIKLLPFAVSCKNGEALFQIEHSGSAFNTISTKWKNILETANENRWQIAKKFLNEKIVETITLDNLIENYGLPDYIKIDVEGHEWECLQGLNQKVRVISFEANLPEFKSETIACIKHLHSIDKSVIFKFIVDDESFENEAGFDCEEMVTFITKTQRRYIELFSFMQL